MAVARFVRGGVVALSAFVGDVLEWADPFGYCLVFFCPFQGVALVVGYVFRFVSQVSSIVFPPSVFLSFFQDFQFFFQAVVDSFVISVDLRVVSHDCDLIVPWFRYDIFVDAANGLVPFILVQRAVLVFVVDCRSRSQLAASSLQYVEIQVNHEVGDVTGCPRVTFSNGVDCYVVGACCSVSSRSSWEGRPLFVIASDYRCFFIRGLLYISFIVYQRHVDGLSRNQGGVGGFDSVDHYSFEDQFSVVGDCYSHGGVVVVVLAL